jgi:pilus assembly protein CpaF
VTQVSEITGMEGEVMQMQTIFEFVRTGIGPDGSVQGDLRATGLRPKFLDHLRLSGVEISADMFDPQKAL